jgi:hypothetical protein
VGNKLFGVNVSKIIKDEIGPGVLDATLIAFTTGTRTGGQPTAGTNPTSVSYPCKGFIDTQASRDLTGTLVADGGKVVVLIGDTISSGAAAPSLNDHITIEGTTYVISVIDRDPAAATYTCQVEDGP